MVNERSTREHLESRVRRRLEQMGMPELSAQRMAATAVDNFYAQKVDHHRDLVSTEAFEMIQSTLVPAVAQFRALAANVLETVRQSWAAIEPFVEMLDKARPATPRVQPFSLSEVNVAIDTGDGWETLRGVKSVELGDEITGAPHHYIINGDHSECPCGGDHSTDCTTWKHTYGGYKHKGSICKITRTLCTHHPKHTYGQPCGEYHENLAELARFKKERAEGLRGCIAHGGPDCICEVTSAEPE